MRESHQCVAGTHKKSLSSRDAAGRSGLIWRKDLRARVNVYIFHWDDS